MLLTSRLFAPLRIMRSPSLRNSTIDMKIKNHHSLWHSARYSTLSQLPQYIPTRFLSHEPNNSSNKRFHQYGWSHPPNPEHLIRYSSTSTTENPCLEEEIVNTVEEEIFTFEPSYEDKVNDDPPNVVNDDVDGDSSAQDNLHRLSKIIATSIPCSRRNAELLIREGEVTISGKVFDVPHYLLDITDEACNSVKVSGKKLSIISPAPYSASTKSDNTTTKFQPATRVWLVHKLPGELVTENDPEGRPSMIERLYRGGVGKSKKTKQKTHLIPIGRLDMATEGLILITNNGKYAQQMELPSNKFHRTYRARVHGRITQSKMNAMRFGFEIKGTKYKGMKVALEQTKGSGSRSARAANSWLRITCQEGKNRQIRKILKNLGLTVTRLIRTSFGDYKLHSIPAGMAIEIPLKPLDNQRRKGNLERPRKRSAIKEAAKETSADPVAAPVQWIKNF